MGAIVRNIVNDQLLRLSYKDPKNIKRFLRNWGGLEGLSEKGDTVATCILTDLKTVTAIAMWAGYSIVIALGYIRNM